MTSYHVSYRIGSTEFSVCCFDIAEAYGAAKDVMTNDRAFFLESLEDIMCVLVDMKRSNSEKFELGNLRISVRKGD